MQSPWRPSRFALLGSLFLGTAALSACATPLTIPPGETVPGDDTAGSAGSGGEGGSAGSSAGSGGEGGSAGSGTSGSAGEGGTAGAAGEGGSSGTAGEAGSAGSGGSSGAAGEGGGAGSAGNGGSGGSAGSDAFGGSAGEGGAGNSGEGGADPFGGAGGSSGTSGNGGNGGSAGSGDDIPDGPPGSFYKINEIYVDRALLGDWAEWVEIMTEPGASVNHIRLRHYGVTGGAWKLKFDVAVGSAGDVALTNGLWSIGGAKSPSKATASIASPENWGMSEAGTLQLYNETTSELLDVVAWGSVPSGNTPDWPFTSVEGPPVDFGPSGDKTISLARRAGAADTDDNAADFCIQTSSANVPNATTCAGEEPGEGGSGGASGAGGSAGSGGSAGVGGNAGAGGSEPAITITYRALINEIFVDRQVKGDKYEWVEILTTPGASMKGIKLRYYSVSGGAWKQQFDVAIGGDDDVALANGTWSVGGILSPSKAAVSIASPDNWGMSEAGALQLYDELKSELLDVVAWGNVPSSNTPEWPWISGQGASIPFGSGDNTISLARKLDQNTGDNAADFCIQSTSANKPNNSTCK